MQVLHLLLLAIAPSVGAFLSITSTSNDKVARISSTSLALFGGGGKIPKSPNERDNQAISAVQSAISSPKTKGFPLIECEFPALKSLNKLGDGTLRSSNEVDQANLAFCKKLIQSLAPVPFLGPNIRFVTSSSASNAFAEKAKSILRGTPIISLRDGIPEDIAKGDVCIVVAPNGRIDYKAAQSLAESSAATVVLINGLAKDQDSVSDKATMAYYLKPLTYNSQVVGYLTRQYPQKWTVIDAVTQKALGSFTDDEILFGNSNTPDLRASGRLVQKATDERAIAARQN